MIRNIILTLTFICVLISAYFYQQSKTLLSISTLIGSIIAFLGAIVNKIDSKKRPTEKTSMNQCTGSNSSSIQVNGNISINKNNRESDK